MLRSGRYFGSVVPSHLAASATLAGSLAAAGLAESISRSGSQLPVQHGVDYLDMMGEGAEPGGGNVNVPGALNELSKEMRSEFKTSVTSAVAKNIAAQTEETKKLAVALVTATLSDPALPSKVAVIISDFSSRPHLRSQISGALATNVVGTDWLNALTLPLVKRQLDWWLVKDDLEDGGGSLWLRKQLVALGVWMVPSRTVEDLARWLLVQQLDTKTGCVNAPFVAMAAAALYPWQVPNVEWAIGEQIHWCLRDQWYKDYAKEQLVASLSEIEKRRRGEAEEEE